MKLNPLCLGVVGLVFFILRASSAPLYVDLNSTNPVSPYSDWSSAATNIQDAIDASSDGDQIWVTNGIYQTGGRVMAGDLTNRVALNKAVTVESVNGPFVTIIQGAGATNGTRAVRCAWLTNGAALIGLTLQGGATRTSGDIFALQSGGGAYCASVNAIVGNCIIQSNAASYQGGGVYQGAINNCALRGNVSRYGAASFAVVNNSTIVNNTGYGVYLSNFTNCIVFFNTPANNYAAGTFAYCCITPLPSGVGNLSADPQLLGDGIHLSITSPCRGSGTNLVIGTDIDGQVWNQPPSIGCDEWQPAPVITVQPNLQFFPDTRSLSINVSSAGQDPFTCFWSKDGNLVQDDGHYASSGTTNLLVNGYSASDAGAYQVVVSNAFGMATSQVAQVVIHCVDTTGTNPVSPYSTWPTAATNMQDAINVALSGEIVLVTNGVYAFGGKVMAGDLTNRVVLNKAITVQSINGPSATTIYGAGGTNGLAAVRCAWLTNGAALYGFTLEGGATRTTGGYVLQNGGGVWCASTQPVIANCIIISNSASYFGGGVYYGNLKNCALYGNTALDGGGAYASVMNNCTVTRNWATLTAGGTDSGYFTNCIVCFNSSAFYSAPGNPGTNYQYGSWSYSCTAPLPSGDGNISADPQISVDNIHLAETSPCRGAGTNTVGLTDIEGYAWSNPPSMGCAEWRPAPFVGQLNFQLNDNGGLTINVPVVGQSPLACSWTRNGVSIEEGAGFGSVQTTNLTVKNLNLLVGALYQAVVTNTYGSATSYPALFPIHCVDVAGVNPLAPYSTWATAATNIQDAITASAAGDIVLVTNGLYAVGGKSMNGTITNRVSVDKAILVQSVNGPNVTIIQGAWDPISTNGPGAVRCAWLTNYATLSGFMLRGGATPVLYSLINGGGGGVWGTSVNATVFNCVIATNFAYYQGGGACQVTLNNCTLTGNHAFGSGIANSGIANAGSGGGAVSCNLKNCLITSNIADQSDGAGALNCNATNCALINNVSGGLVSGASYGTLANCTVASNLSKISYSGSGGAVANATLFNCIVYGNSKMGSGPANYFTNNPCNFSYTDTDPLPPGTGNLDVDPQLLADGVHLAATSPCIGAGTASVVFGTDIDGQPWNNPPSIGCDEWQPAPIIWAPPAFQINSPAHGLTFNLIVAGQSPFSCFWSKDGAPIPDDGHHSNSGTANLVVNNFGPDDAGLYQVVVSNAFGVATSQVAQVVIHAVDAAGANPVPPYSTWTTAATNIQDAINIASAGDIVLVTNGIYATGGKVMAGDLTNRVVLDRPVTVMSVNGYSATVIQGVWDPVSTNGTGPGAVRCAYLADGAVLNGFTLQNGATRATGDSYSGGSLESGGGIRCVSTNGVVSDCLLTNNSAIYGGGIASYGTLNNSLVIFNLATFGGGAYYTTLNNCTVVNNYTTTSYSYHGAGTYNCSVRNSIVLGNYDNWPLGTTTDNYYYTDSYSYSCTSPTKSGTGNINGITTDPQFLDWFHIASTSPCRGAGSALYASGTDLDGEPWANPPSMGCDEVIVSNLVGPLSVNIRAYQTNALVNHYAGFWGIITGRVAYAAWSFGDGSTTNSGAGISHQWTNSGDYTVTLTAYNNDNPAGVSTNILFQVLPLNTPQLEATMLLTNGFQFQFAGQWSAYYTIQYATNLASPVTWQTLQTIPYNTADVIQITDSAWTNTARFYRVLAQ